MDILRTTTLAMDMEAMEAMKPISQLTFAKVLRWFIMAIRSMPVMRIITEGTLITVVTLTTEGTLITEVMLPTEGMLNTEVMLPTEGTLNMEAMLTKVMRVMLIMGTQRIMVALITAVTKAAMGTRSIVSIHRKSRLDSDMHTNRLQTTSGFIRHLDRVMTEDVDTRNA